VQESLIRKKIITIVECTNILCRFRSKYVSLKSVVKKI